MVLCSRNARPEKGLVRRPHVDQHGCPLPRVENKQALKGQVMDGSHSMREVKDSFNRSLQERHKEFGRSSLGLLAHLGVSVCGRVKKLHANE